MAAVPIPAFDHSPPAVDWWANLNQGLISSVLGSLVGGIVAALTAYLVVRLTRHHERALALEIEAKKALCDLVQECTGFIARGSANQDFEGLAPVAAKAAIACSLLRAVDEPSSAAMRVLAARLMSSPQDGLAATRASELTAAAQQWLNEN